MMSEERILICTQVVSCANKYDKKGFESAWGTLHNFSERFYVANHVDFIGGIAIDIWNLQYVCDDLKKSRDNLSERVVVLEESLKDKEQQEARVRVHLKRLQRQIDGIKDTKKNEVDDDKP